MYLLAFGIFYNLENCPELPNMNFYSTEIYKKMQINLDFMEKKQQLTNLEFQ